MPGRTAHRDATGPSVPRRARLIVVRRIDVPAEVAFAALTDLALQSRWILATRVRPRGGLPPPPVVGSELVARTGVGAIGFDDVMRVTEHLPPHRWRVEHTGRLVRGWGQWGVLPDVALGRGCRVYWAEAVEVPPGPLGRIGEAVAGPLVRAGVRLSLARLARGLESGRWVPAA